MQEKEQRRDALREPEVGPNSMWAEDKPPSRGQWQTIATLALDVLGMQRPASRMDASIAISRLRAAQLEAPPEQRPEAFEPW